MKTVYLHEFERHLRKAHMWTEFACVAKEDHGFQEIVWGLMTNILITRGTIFQASVMYFHPAGRHDQAELGQPFFDLPLSGQTGFQYLDEEGCEVSRETVCELVLGKYPEIMNFDTPVPNLEEVGQRTVSYRDDYRAYCLQDRGRPDLVFDGLLIDWGYDDIPMFDDEGCLWVDRTMFRTSEHKYVTLEERSVLRGQKCLYRDRKLRVFLSEREAGKCLYGEDIDEIAQELEVQILGDRGQQPKDVGHGAQIIPFPRLEPLQPGRGAGLELVKPAPVRLP